MEKDKLWQLRLLFAWLDRWEKEDEDLERRQDGREGNEDLQQNSEGTEDRPRNEDKWFSDSGGTWLRKEVIERLRWSVWNITTGGTGNGGTEDDG